MIYAKVKLDIRDYETIPDNKIKLYRGDKNVQIRFIFMGNIFTILENTFAQIVILCPSGASIFSEIERIEDNTVVLTISEAMIDEVTELGVYSFQIRLYDDECVSRVTLPPCYNMLEILDPLVVDYGMVNTVIVNRAVTTQGVGIPEIFDEDGQYIKTNWMDGDLITDSRLNKIEEAIYTNRDDISTILGIIDKPPTYTKPSLTISLTKNIVEHNVSSNITITPRFTQNDAGSIVSYTLYKNNTEIYSNQNQNNFTDSITLQHGGSVTYKSTVGYSDGIIKDSLLGIPYPQTAIKAGNISATATITCYAPSYNGVTTDSTINGIEGLNKALQTNKSGTFTFNLNNQRIVYAYPKSFGNLTSIKDANNFDYINSYTLSNAIFNNVEYNIYILTDPVTITGFKQIFN